MRVQVLVIEDDQAIRDGVCDALETAGMSALGAASGEIGLDQLRHGVFDLLLLDVVLPGRDGFQVLREVRQSRPRLPVILLTAKGDVNDRVRGLQLGADDYVVKPFNARELLARVEAVMRRSPPSDRLALVMPVTDGCQFDFAHRAIVSADRTVELSEKESEVLRYLMMHANRVITRDEILVHVWNLNPKGLSTRTIDMHIARLREKLDVFGAGTSLKTLRGQGYLFERRMA